MKSSLKVDFCDRKGNGIERIIRVFIDGASDDPRDSLLKTLFQSTGDFLQIEYTGHKHVNNSAGLPELEKTLILFKPEPNWLLIHDNSNGFRAFLDFKGVKWEGAEHSTAVYFNNPIDLFELGKQLPEYKAAHPNG